MQVIDSDSLSGIDISSPFLVSTYTADQDREIYAHVYLSTLSGNGSYRICTTKQLSGAGTAYQSPTSAVFATFGVTTVYLISLPTQLELGDVLNIYVQGLDLDVAVDCVVQIFDNTVDTSGLATTLHVQEVEDKVDTVQAKTDQLAFTVPNQVDANALAGGSGATAQDVWEYATRELTSGANIDLSGLALESTLTAMKGAGWTTETLKSIKEAISLIPEGITIQDLKDIVIEGDFTFYDLLKVIPAALAGKLNGGGTGTLHFRNLMDTLDRITAEVDLETGDRTSITLDLT